jgi:hypothetical protein
MISKKVLAGMAHYFHTQGILESGASYLTGD